MIDKDDDPELRRWGNSTKGKTQSPLYRVSFVALAEAIGGVLREIDRSCCEKATGIAYDLFNKGRIELCGFGETNECYTYAAQLMKEDNRLAPMDALIVACSLLDATSSGLHTTDPTILCSQSIQNEARSKGKFIHGPPELRRKKGW